jgi:ADP-ribose pyrophosphatase YjhB (NUDIX family)
VKVKRSVALAIRDPAHPRRVLLVRRPDDDDDLPAAWGLPAASLLDDESWEDAVRRAGRDKLGVRLEPGSVLGSGSTVRSTYRLDMRLYAAQLLEGTPEVPQPGAGVTQYQAWHWGSGDELRPASLRGSLCCRLFLEAHPDSP